ncbi:MAG: diphosphomevalonate decarboxylase [Chloroflexi bacterium]|nr:diphosphomevalonate decarboxylase [Chloroflexota bacterium]
MNTQKATAIAHPNIAFIKYWGNRDQNLRIPATDSLSMNLDGLTTRTEVNFDSSLQTDILHINAQLADDLAQQRIGEFLNHVRLLAGIKTYAFVKSENNFPMGTGIASSASAFAALSLAASVAAGLDLSEGELSRLARRGSGSASRSVPAGFVLWKAGTSDLESFAQSIASPDHWELVDCIAIVSDLHKSTGSSDGHPLAQTSPVQALRIEHTERNINICQKAICERDFETFAQVTELDCNLMHAVMMTSEPPLHYWQPATLAIIQAVKSWRAAGLPVCYTIDAGPNVHVITKKATSQQVSANLRDIPGVSDVLTAAPGGPARIIS